ncbi:uncharacterized protein LOC135844044 isoform X2 [Planococcus citri]|uniref:uncharacterized protein LOC135844044 isoform X2 n=1 Tax=Planococcus citri TaxID=170843 RepID=UPI0031F7646D
MFTHRVKPQSSTWLQKTKKQHETTPTPYLDLKKFRKHVSFFICNERNAVNLSSQIQVIRLLNTIRRTANGDRNYDNDKSNKMFNLFLFASSTNAFWAGKYQGRNQTLGASSRNTLAYAIRKVYRENIPELGVISKHFYSTAILRRLGIPENKWDNYGVPNRFLLCVGSNNVSHWVHLNKFSKKLGIYICNECSLNASQFTQLMSMVEEIQGQVKSDENKDQQNASYKTDNTLLKYDMTGYCDESNFEVERRKILAIALMEVFRETVPRLKGSLKFFFAWEALLILGVPRSKWNTFYLH